MSSGIDFSAILKEVLRVLQETAVFLYETLRTTSVQDTQNYARRTWREMKKTAQNPTRMSWVQALVVFGVITIIILSIIQQLSAYYQEHLPEVMSAFIKFLVYIIIPILTTLSISFGMYLERQYQKFDDLHEFYVGFRDSLASMVQRKGD